MRSPTFSVEVITLPVSDVERALRFYVDQVGRVTNVTLAYFKGKDAESEEAQEHANSSSLALYA